MVKQKPDLRLVIDIESAPDYGRPFLRFRAKVCYIGEDGRLLNPLDSDRLNGLASYADLTITAQRDDTSADFYGMHVEYRDVFSADLRRVELMVKQLRAIERHMDTLEKRFGYPESFQAWLWRAADAIGVETFVWRGRERDLDTKNLGWAIDQCVRDWQKDNGLVQP